MELPTLMRNPYVERIIVVQNLPSGRWSTEVQWNVNNPEHPGREYRELMSLDDRLSAAQIPNTKRMR